MKTIKIILGASIALLALVACDKKQEEPVQPQEPTEIVKETPQDTPKKEEKKREEKEKPPAKDILAPEEPWAKATRDRLHSSTTSTRAGRPKQQYRARYGS